VPADPVTGPGEVTEDRPRLFTVRIWSEVCAGGIEHRGQVRDVTSGAYRGFRTWPELTSFLTDHLGSGQPATSAEAQTRRRNHEQ